MSLFETKVKSEYVCPRCNGVMFVVARPVNVVELICQTCDSVLSVDYVQGWHDGRKSQSAQHSVQADETYCGCKDEAFINDDTPGKCGNCGKPFRR